MNETPPRCPDCGVTMDEMALSASGCQHQFVSEESKGGILGSLGAKQQFGVDAFVCAECGLSRLYADLE